MIYKKDLNLEDRINLELNGPGNYKVVNNIIYTRAIEINAVRHCNLSCRSCSHSAPLAKKQILNIRKVKEDLEKLSKYMKCETVRIVGGEPLLHPEFNQLINAIKESKISKNICLVTNGILLHTIDEETLSSIDKIEISLYPLEDKIVSDIKEQALKISENGKKVRILEYSFFRESISKIKSDNEVLINEIYNTCQIAHFWRCLTVDNGRIYRCPQSMIYTEKFNDNKDVLEIDKIDNVNKLLLFLENNKPIQACYYCLGSVGKSFKHEQIKRTYWQEKLPDKPEDAIDSKYIKQLLEDARRNSECMERKNIDIAYGN